MKSLSFSLVPSCHGRGPRILACLALLALYATACLGTGMQFEHLAALRTVGEVAVSPDASLVAYTLAVPRIPGQGEEDGPAFSELWVVPTAEGGSGALPYPRPYVQGDVRVSDLSFSPDGSLIFYLSKRRDDEQTSLWAVPVAGGESRRMLAHDTDISAYDLSPDGSQVVIRAQEKEPQAVADAEEAGYDAEIFEEDWLHVGLWIAELPPFVPPVPAPQVATASGDAPSDEARPGDSDAANAADAASEPRRLELGGTASEPRWSADGRTLLTAVQPRNLIDDRYTRRKVRLFDAGSGELVAAFENPGKLGAYRLSPDGRHVAMVSAADPHDTREGRLMVAEVAGGGGELRDLMPDYQAHVNDFRWQTDDSILFTANVGSETVLGTVHLSTDRSPPGGAGEAEGAGEREAGSKHLLTSGDGLPVIARLEAEGCTVALVGETPRHPREVFLYRPCEAEAEPRRLTHTNPWLDDVELARQEVITWTASDGLELEGIFLHPLEESEGPAPLLLMVHGGPESNDRNGWVTSYSRPGQLAAAAGFAVLYPNYRGSTGRGVEFARSSQGDAAGKEFQDLVEAVDHLVAEGIADADRVGITGGSYGGYATAWCSTYYTDRFRAGVMFVGISNKLSKGFTTDIPLEDIMVHTRFDPWEKWQFGLERSPLYHAEKSRTALLIAGGDADTRVHPSQSLQLYRAFELMDKTVRYVRYPGEPHGNRRAASRDDYARRLMRWMIHFVREKGEGLPDPALPAIGEKFVAEGDGEKG